MTQNILTHELFEYILKEELVCDGDEPTKLPPMGELADALGVSKGKLREELLAAQAYGVIEMRPGDGTYVRPFDFYTAIRPAVLYGIACDKRNFDRLYRMRAQLEATFWGQAVSTLTPEDLARLVAIVEHAERKLGSTPIEIPHREHRDFHLLIFSRLENPFVIGFLQAYWDGYEAVELHRYFDLSYYREMWASHRQIVQMLQQQQYQQGQEVLVQHFLILENRLQTVGG
ncbi:MAG: FadR family transcriptional regulator [Anaerolineae bacterium]|nr:FadR family transcriptional regulator [Anaerolineae bacterium]